MDATAEGLSARLDSTSSDLRAQLDTTTGELSARLDSTAGELSARLDSTAGNLNARLDAAAGDLSARLESTHEVLDAVRTAQGQAQARVLDVDRRLEQAREDLSGRLCDQAEQVDRLEAQFAAQDQDLRRLGGELAGHAAATLERLQALRAEGLTAADLESLRNQQQAAMASLAERLARHDTLVDALRGEIGSRMGQLDATHRQDAAGLASRIDESASQLSRMRQRLVRHHAEVEGRLSALAEQFAAREDLEQLRTEQLERAEQIIGRVQADRQAVQQLVEELTSRCTENQARLTALAGQGATNREELVQLRRSQAEDVSSLLRQLEDQRCSMQEQFDQALAQWSETQQEITALRGDTARSAEVEEVRRRQTQHAERLLEIVSTQRQHLESLIAAVDSRCEAMTARIDALPAEIATADNIRALHDENKAQRDTLEAAIRGVANQCNRTEEALRELEGRCASGEELRQVRELQDRHRSEMIARMEGQAGEVQQEVSGLNQRWQDLQQEVTVLAATTTPAARFEAAEQTINREVTGLREQLSTADTRREQDTRTLIEAITRMSERIRQMEEAERPKPVSISLEPQAAERLAELNELAGRQAEGLAGSLDRAQHIGGRLDHCAGQVSESLEAWSAGADLIRRESEQLTAGTRNAAELIGAMKKCHEAIDRKLRSQQWQNELARGEALATRLEQAAVAAGQAADRLTAAITDAGRCAEVADQWAGRRDETLRLARTMAGLIKQAQAISGRFDRMTEHVGSLMSGIAQKTSGLAEVIHSARDYDQQRPTRSPNPEAVSERLQWPAFKVA